MVKPEDIDALLPQTQCGLCTYGGCMPYAEAIVYENAPINLCPPGGVNTLRQLGDLLHQDVSPYISDMAQKAKPKMLAVIRENECIGCTKCIQACPVDAILGSTKQMHTVIGSECTGCELCIAPCPVDCIDMVPANQRVTDELAQANHARSRFLAREKRLTEEKRIKDKKMEAASLQKKRHYIEIAMQRVREKKQTNFLIKQNEK